MRGTAGSGHAGPIANVTTIERESAMNAKRKQRLRRHFFVDPSIQGALILRIVVYWTTSMVAMAAMILCWRIETGTPATLWSRLGETAFYCGPIVIVSLLLLPLVVVDMIRFSNRFVGPLLRLRRSMRQLARGQRVEPIEFRRKDLWRELAADFNAIASHAQGHPVTPREPLPPESQPAELETADC